MAIKGKSKTRAKKAVTRGPKPAYVEPSKPLLARRGLQVGLAAVVVAIAALGLWYGFSKQHQKDEARAKRRAAAALQGREQDAFRKYGSVVEPALSGVGQPNPPTAFTFLPDLANTLDGLRKGDVSARDALQVAKAAAEVAKSASKAIDGVDLVEVIRDKGFSLDLVNYLLNSQTRMVEGLDLSEQVALTLQEAAQSNGAEREALLASAAGVWPTAKKVFDEGYSDYIQAETMVGLFNPLPAGASLPPVVPSGG